MKQYSFCRSCLDGFSFQDSIQRLVSSFHFLIVTSEMIFATLFVLVAGVAFFKWLRRDRDPPIEDEPVESLKRHQADLG